MANNTNVMSIAPNQAATSARRISPNTQPKYKTAARSGKGNFGATLDQIHAKLDELKQNIRDLQDNAAKPAPVEGNDKPLDTTTETPAQGTSNTPQDAEKAIGNAQGVMRNDSEIAKDDVQPADIFLGKSKPVVNVNVTLDPTDVAEVPTTQTLSPRLEVQPDNVALNPTVAPEVSTVQPLSPRSEIQPDNVALNPTDAPANFLAANNAAYLFGMNAETLLETKPVVQVEAPKVDGVQNLMSLMPQADDSNAQSMLNMLGGRAWRQRDFQPAQIQPTLQAQPASVTLDPTVEPEVPTTQTLSPRLEVAPQIQTQPVDVQPAQVQPTLQAQAQPIITPQRVDERPAQQIFSEMLGVNVQVEDAPTAAPVTPPQSSTQQFNQPQRDAQQNFQGQQTFQAAPNDAPQAQPITTGGEVFAPNLTPATDAPQNQPTTPAQAPDAPPPAPQDDFDIPAQIVRQARLIRTTENTEMVIKLNPEHLGELTLRVSVSQNGAVNASFHSDNATVRTIIENALVQLRQELSNIGLKVENVDVYAGLSDGGLPSGQGGQAWQQGRQQRQGNRQIDLNTIERDVDATAPVNESTTDGVDYSV